MKLSTINLVVEGLLESCQKKYEDMLNAEGVIVEDVRKAKAKKLAEAEVNIVCIAMKTACIAEMNSIEEAIEYYKGTHTEDEFQEFRTSIVLPKLEEMKKRSK